MTAECQTRVCNTCGVEKPLTVEHFYPKDGECRACFRLVLATVRGAA